MHGVDQTEAFLDAAFPDQSIDGAGDVHEAAAVRDFKPKMLGQRFNARSLISSGYGKQLVSAA